MVDVAYDVERVVVLPVAVDDDAAMPRHAAQHAARKLSSLTLLEIRRELEDEHERIVVTDLHRIVERRGGIGRTVQNDVMAQRPGDTGVVMEILRAPVRLVRPVDEDESHRSMPFLGPTREISA